MEEFLYEKVQGKKPIRLVESDLLGQYMIDAGNDMGASAAYGIYRSYLYKYRYLNSLLS